MAEMELGDTRFLSPLHPKLPGHRCLMHSLLKYLLTPYADAISFCGRTPHPPDLPAESSLAIHPRSSSFHFHNSLHPVCVVRVPIRPSRALYYGLNGFGNSISRIIGLCLVALLLYWIVGSQLSLTLVKIGYS